jgi:mycobactin peptide synthetase MbtE
MVKQVVHSVFEDAARRHADRVALGDPAGTISYRSLNAAANGLAARLRERHGVAQGSVVGLYMPSGAAYLIGMLAIAKAGGVFVALDPLTPVLRQRRFVQKVQPVLVLTDAERTGQWPAVGVSIPTLSVAAATSEPVEDPPLAATGDDASYIVFTSGSTGEPKAILGSQKGLSHFVHWEIGELALNETVRASQLAAPTFDVSLREIFVPLLAGGTVCIPGSECRGAIDRLLDWLEAERITLLHAVPSLFRTLTEAIRRRQHPDRLLPDLRHVLLAGEPLYGADVQKWRSSIGERIELVNLYGPSETTLAKAFYRIPPLTEGATRMIPVGHPLPNTALLVIRDGELCDPGEIGEVYIRTPFMSHGYYRDPALTAQSFVQNPLRSDVADVLYRTGDMGRYRADRSVELLGREDDQVKVKGIRVELAEIEQALLQHPSVQQAVVLAHRSAGHDVYLSAYYIAAAPISHAELREHLGQWLPESMHPAFFAQMDEFPLNLHGKVVRRALPRPADLLYQQQPYVAPAGEIEERLSALWDDVLHVRNAGVTHAFVEVGGDSLSAVRLLPRIAQQFDVDITLAELFPRGTIREIASVIASRRPQTPPSAPEERNDVAAATPDELQWLAE